MQRTRAWKTGAVIAIATACCAGMAQGSGQTSVGGASAALAGDARDAGRPHTLVVVPQAVSMSTDFMKGCWVRLYDGEDFRGQELMLVGPLRLSGMGPTSPWWRLWNSALVGPNARVTVYSGGNYEGRSASLAAGHRFNDLGAKDLDWYGKIESAQVHCNAG